MIALAIATAYLYVAGGFCFASAVDENGQYRRGFRFWGCVAAWPLVLAAAFVMMALED
jgi:hypothetical protein